MSILLVGAASAFFGVLQDGTCQAYFSKNSRSFVSEYMQGGGMGEFFVAASVTDLWTGDVEELEIQRRVFNCALLAEPHGEGNEEEFDRDAAQGYVRECEEKNAAAESAFDDALQPHRERAAADRLSLTSHSGKAKLEIAAAAGQPPVKLDAARPMFVRGEKGGRFVARLAVPGRPVREFNSQFNYGTPEETLWFNWSPDDQWIAVGRYGGADVHPAIAKVDVLDAGAGARLAEVTKKLEAAGYAPSHQAKAKTPRKTSEIFVMKGFEDDGKLVAKALGLPDDSVKPLTWASAYAVTIAVGAE